MPPTRLTTPFGATSTADDMVAGLDLSERRAIVTGAETARALAQAGAEVTLAVRNVAEDERVWAKSAPAPTGAAQRSPSLVSTSPTRLRSRSSSHPGVGRSTSWWTTRV
ncbi:hypothetical protein N1027_06915 [Herbiconiux sp. CPCC 205763]|uniref:Uncharacterized protein n=1 Tax=Herbiconiux aconitum TaxID=2970913 RepID=A0ABT2GNW7_9MICO|nr:hypothetical protein [Herbiconiux aconitum]MCS5717863.1 hypothetical protein [Herbiconiux aconitum]